MTGWSRKGVTYEDVLAAPADKIAEILESDLYLSPRPAQRHANAASALGADLHDAFQRGRSGPGGWWILFEPEIHSGSDVLVPDIPGWRKQSLAALPEIGWFDSAPDWLCELISPSTSRIDRGKKLPISAGADVEWIRIVDPALKTLEVLHRRDDRYVLRARTSARHRSAHVRSKR